MKQFDQSFFALKSILLAFLFFQLPQFIQAQGPQNRAVEMSATIQEDPPQIKFNWPWDWSEGGYAIHKRLPGELGWGTVIDSLPWGATEWIDTNVVIGKEYEYVFFKQKWVILENVYEVPSGATLTFTINNIYGDGICCNFGFGWYEVTACDNLVATGSEFGFTESITFEVCNNGNPTEEIRVTLSPDMLVNNTWWTLTNDQNGNQIGSSGPQGSNLVERAKYGFIQAGIKAPPIENRGSILLLVDDFYTTELAAEIRQLQIDFITDGWKIIRKEINRDSSVTHVKSIIQDIYQNEEDLKALMLLGHIPVPYSGSIYPDGHSENHWGAWPTDTYYGELTGDWTDETVNNITALFPPNHNIPGDGKFDQSAIPTSMELQVGRVDLFDLPAFAENDIELTRQYLNKNHLFKTGQIEVERRALVDDNLNIVLGAPAATAWRNFATMFHANNVHDGLDYFNNMSQESYLFSYGCGGGSHVSAAGIGTTEDFANDSLLTVFTMLLGSQFGDWDNTNNFLRAPLAQGLTLTNCWAGNPPWTLHQMAMGRTIGECTMLTQNSSLEDYHPGPQLVHTNLMGDPTLRLHPVKMPEAFQLDTTALTVELNWETPQNETISGYYLYRSNTLHGNFERIHNEVITDTFYTDTTAFEGKNVYMLRTLKLENSGSGSYYNLSLGMIDSIQFMKMEEEDTMIIDFTTELYEEEIQIYPNPSNGIFYVDFLNNDFQEYQLELRDALGKIVHFENTLFNESNIQLDLSFLPNGIFYLSLKNNKKEHLKKLIIN